jgi:hypothetical protein
MLGSSPIQTQVQAEPAPLTREQVRAFWEAVRENAPVLPIAAAPVESEPRLAVAR